MPTDDRDPADGFVLTATVLALLAADPPATTDVDGSPNNDSMVGTAGADTLQGLAGDDTLVGNGGNDRLVGGSGADSLDGGAGNDTLVGGTGGDTYVVGAAGDMVSETSTLAGEIDTVRSSVNHTLGANLERLVLTGTGALSGTGNTLANGITGNGGANILSGGDGNDTIGGGAGDDTLSGGNGDDSLAGGGGADLVTGGAGNDIYVLDGADLVSETGSSASEIDTVVASATYTLGANFEHLVLAGAGASDGTGNTAANALTGNTAANRLNGGSGSDTLLGNAGDDTLDGGLGSDAMTGGAGNDSYVVGGAGDTVVETGTAAGEVDTVTSTITFTLGANVEHLVLAGGAAIGGTGNGAANHVTGNAGANSLLGADGNDTLLGNGGNDLLNGGAGIDSLVGGAGNDTYVASTAGDVVVETGTSAAEVDRVNASASYTLSANVEQLTLLGSAAMNGTGNASANRVIGNGGANLLSGLAGNDTLDGGAGNDTLDGGTGFDAMDGGAGNDRYLVSAAADTVVETGTLAGEIDTVVTSASFTLGANLERLTITGTTGRTGTGNGLANQLAGGDGADTLVGLGGDDVYLVGMGDAVVEAAGGGTDRVVATVDWVLADEVEQLELTGSADLSGTGNSLANRLTGNTGANALDGDDGNDTLVGGAGADTLTGGNGDDLYSGAGTGDQLVELGEGGTDTVTTAAAAFTLAAEIEVLQYIGAGSFAGTGNGSVNRIVGGAGADTLDGGTGADSLEGGAGSDVYLVDSADDAVTDSGGAADEVRTTLASLTLAAELERLRFVGTGDFHGLGNTSANRIEGGVGNDLLGGLGGIDTLVGGAGDDSYQVQLDADVLIEQADGGTDLVITQGGIWTLAAGFEQLAMLDTGTGNGNAQANLLFGETGLQVFDGLGGNDSLYGGADTDSLLGGDGDDLLQGDQGEDTMDGGEGSDAYVTDGLDQIADSGGGALDVDTVTSRATLVLGAGLENLVLAPEAFASAGTGNAGDNRITGNADANTLTGGGGADTLIGDGGNDTYSGVDAGDTLTEVAGGGDDLVTTLLASYTLAAQVERLSFIGVAGSYAGTGNDAANTLTGTAGSNDTLDGLVGADTMIGLAGNDLYFVDNAGDVVTEGAAAGIDEIRTTRTTLTIAANVEKLTYVGAITFTGTGGSGNDTITGGSAGDSLNGGAGADSLIGGLGNDSYGVDEAGDVVVETSTLAGETDLVASSVAFTLGSNVENLTLTGTATIDGSGNALANVLLGNNANNLLSGLGGNDSLVGNAGNDTLSGGAGDDTLNGVLNGGTDSLVGGSGNDRYIVTTGDIVSETSTLAAEIDTVQSSISYTLGSNLENLVLSGPGNLAGTGNALANTLTGGAGNDTLTGGGGLDELTGGDGNDVFRIDFTASSSRDVVTDFDFVGTDLLSFDMSATNIGNADTTIDGAVSTAGAWAANAELVVDTTVLSDLSAATVGTEFTSASTSVAAGARKILVAHSLVGSAVFLFVSDGDADVETAELTQLVVLIGATLAPTDFGFVA